MKHFVVEATYLVPFEQIPRHRRFLQRGYDAGWFLCSGPQNPPVGGFWSRAPSQADLEAVFADEPFHAEHLGSYRFDEFDPVKRQPWTED